MDLHFEEAGLDEIPVRSDIFFPVISQPDVDPIGTDPLDLKKDPLLETPVKFETENLIVKNNVKDTLKSPRKKNESVGELKAGILDIIKESIYLFQRHPASYHAFYLRLHKFISKVQLMNLISSANQALEIWEEYDDLADALWAKRNTRAPYSKEPSAYAIYMMRQRVIINGKDVTDTKRNDKELQKRFDELELIAKAIRENWKKQRSSSVIDLKSRLQFFQHCRTMTYPGDVVKMNDLWSKLLSGFKEDTVSIPSANVADLDYGDIDDDVIQVKIKEDEPPKPAPRRNPRRQKTGAPSRYSPTPPVQTNHERKKRPVRTRKFPKVKLEKELRVSLGNENCPYCDEISFTRSVLEKHVKNNHPHDYFHCSAEGCSKMILTPDEFVSHYQKHEVEAVPKEKLEERNVKRRKTVKGVPQQKESIDVKRKKVFPITKPQQNRKYSKSSTLVVKPSTSKKRRGPGRPRARPIRKPARKMLKKIRLARFQRNQMRLRFTISNIHRRRIINQNRVKKYSDKMQLIVDKIITSQKPVKSFKLQRPKRLTPAEKMQMTTSRLRISKVMSTSRGAKKIQCRFCKKTFQNPNSRKRHMFDKHSELYKEALLKPKEEANKRKNELAKEKRRTGKLKRKKDESNINRFVICEHCGQSISYSRIHYHYFAFHNENRLTSFCPICEKTFKEGNGLWVHFVRDHTDFDLTSKSVEMGISMGLALPEKAFEKPASFVSKDTNICPYCGLVFENMYIANRHCKDVHEAEMLTCQTCDKVFKTKCSLDGHVRQAHEGQEFKCDLCNRKLQGKGKLWKHKVEQHHMTDLEPPSDIKFERCPYCSEIQLRSLLCHIKKTHSGQMAQFQLLSKKRVAVTPEEKRIERNEKRKEARRKWIEEGVVTQKWMMKDRTPNICHICQWPVPLTNKAKLWRQHLEEVHGTKIEVYVRSWQRCKNKRRSIPCPYENCQRLFPTMHYLRQHVAQRHSVRQFGKRLCELGHVEEKKNDKDVNVLYCNLCQSPNSLQSIFGRVSLNSLSELMIHFFLNHAEIYKNHKGKFDPDSQHLAKEANEFLQKKLEEPKQCLLCEQMCNGINQLRTHMEENHSDSCWKCPLDGLVMLSPEEMAEHFAKNHQQNEEKRSSEAVSRGDKGSCRICEDFFDNLEEHVLTHHNRVSYKCSGAPKCDVVRYSERAIAYHETKCLLCFCIVREGVEIISHVKVNCELCEISVNVDSLDNHFKRIHGIQEDLELKCTMCERLSFKTRKGWMRHMEEWHVDSEKEWQQLLVDAGKVHKVDIEKLKAAENVKKVSKRRKETVQRSVENKPSSTSTGKRGRSRKNKSSQEVESCDSEVEQESGLDDFQGASTKTNSSSLRRSTRRRKVKSYKEYELGDGDE